MPPTEGRHGPPPWAPLPGPELAAASASRAAEVVEALAALSDAELAAPSLLPDWARTTIACHLRFGARTLLAMTQDALAGREASYYPGGRGRQRPGTLVPERGESARDVVASLGEVGRSLDEAWAALSPPEWSLTVHEPADNHDLGSVPLAHLPMSRLTEVEVHGVDIGAGLSDWSPWFVSVALPYRIWRLGQRVPPAVSGAGERVSWLLTANDGPSCRVAVTAGAVQAEVVESPATAGAEAVLEATGRDLLALLLGRPLVATLAISGDRAVGAAFPRFFPGP